MAFSVKIAKTLMKIGQVFPTSPEDEIGNLQEIFQHDIFLNSSEVKRNEIMLKSSQSKYKDEMDYPYDNYFGVNLAPLLEGKSVLDLGCFTGGRSTAWFERYHIKSLVGIDVDDVFINAAQQFAKLKGIQAQFKTSVGENLSFDDNSFDAILSFDVLEHVQDFNKTLNECYRVLKPGGRFFLVFPSYYHPNEHHLGLVTKIPGIHYIFSGNVLTKAYYDIINERGQSANWYKRKYPNLSEWEKCNTINGMTLSKFLKILRQNDWKIVMQCKKPIGSIGRNSSKKIIYKILSALFYPLIFVPGLREIFLHRITFILEKPIN